MLPEQYRFIGLSKQQGGEEARESSKDKHFCTLTVDCSVEPKMCFQILAELAVQGETEKEIQCVCMMVDVSVQDVCVCVCSYVKNNVLRTKDHSYVSVCVCAFRTEHSD